MKKHLLTLFFILLIAWPAAAQSTVFYEGFTDNGRKWTNKETAEYNAYLYNGFYFIAHKRASGSWVFWNDAPFDATGNFEITTSIQKISGNKSSFYGIEFARKNARNRYSFLLNSLGEVIINYPDGTTTTYDHSIGIDSEYKAHELKVVRVENMIRFYLDGLLLEENAFQPFGGDKVAFYISKRCKIKADYLKIRETGEQFYEASAPPAHSYQGFGTQQFNFYNLEKRIRAKVEQDLTRWAVKDEFETTAQYQERIEKKEAKITELTQQAIDHFKEEYLKKIDFSDFTVHTYDADAETFKITLNRLGDFYLHVPLEEAREFKENAGRMRFKNVDLKIKQNTWVLSYLEVFDTYSYETFSYDITTAADYSPVIYTTTVTGIDVQLPEYDGVTVYNGQYAAPVKRSLEIGAPDVDVSVPVTEKNNKETYAIIIGNEDYTRYNSNLNSDSNVAFARRDALYFKEYALKTLGIPEENVTFLNDAISTQLSREISRVVTMAKIRNGKVLFYYAGHGFPDPNSKDAYLVPVDVTAEEVHNRGIRLSDLFDQLSDEEILQSTVFLDACFSGGGRDKGLLEGTRFAKIKPNKIKLKGNIVVFSASSGAQVSKPYREMQHGMFTYFLLKKLKESRGEISYGELFEYLDKEVSFTAAKHYSEQQPEVNTSLEWQEKWQEWKF